MYGDERSRGDLRPGLPWRDPSDCEKKLFRGRCGGNKNEGHELVNGSTETEEEESGSPEKCRDDC